MIFSWVCCGRKKDTQKQMIHKWKYDYLQMLNRKNSIIFKYVTVRETFAQVHWRYVKHHRRSWPGELLSCPVLYKCSHARSSWVVYICWMFIDNCVFDINLLQDATFVCVVSEIHVSRPPAPWEEHKNSKEYQFIK